MAIQSSFNAAAVGIATAKRAAAKKQKTKGDTYSSEKAKQARESSQKQIIAKKQQRQNFENRLSKMRSKVQGAKL